MPQSDGGDDSIDNAAPLCPTCHEQYGGNPQKRKQIRDSRDWWYRIVEKTYSKQPELAINTEVVDQLLLKVREQGEEIDSLKQTLNTFVAKYKDNLPTQQAYRMDELIKDMTIESSADSASTIVGTVFGFSSEIESSIGDETWSWTTKGKFITDPSPGDNFDNGEGFP